MIGYEKKPSNKMEVNGSKWTKKNSFDYKSNLHIVVNFLSEKNFIFIIHWQMHMLLFIGFQNFLRIPLNGLMICLWSIERTNLMNEWMITKNQKLIWAHTQIIFVKMMKKCTIKTRTSFLLLNLQSHRWSKLILLSYELNDQK